MAARGRLIALRVVAMALVLTVTLLIAVVSLNANIAAVSAQEPDRAAMAVGFFDAQGAGDLDGAMAAFAPNAVFIGARVTGTCSAATPCTDLAGIRNQIQGNLDIHNCQTVRAVQVAGSVVTGQLEARNDVARANGIARVLHTFIMQIPSDQITFFANLN